MNMRVVLYGVVGLVLVLALSGGEEGGTSSAAFALTLRQQASYKNECMKEVVGFESSIHSKMKFCACVVTTFEESINKNEKLIEAHKTFVSKYAELRDNPREASRSLASSSQHTFSGGSLSLDILLSTLDWRHDFAETREMLPDLGKAVDEDWKASMLSCARHSQTKAETSL